MGSILSSLRSLPPPADFFPPTPEAYSILIGTFQYFPVVSNVIILIKKRFCMIQVNYIQVSILQWLLAYHPAGKTSVKNSFFNLPGRFAWCVMEIVGPLNLLYTLYKLPPMVNISSLPLSNKLAASLYLIHYVNRAIISPWFAAPSMSPIHALVAGFAIVFNWINSSCLAAWLVGYHIPIVQGYKTDGAAAGPSTRPLHGHPTPGFATQILPVIGLGLFAIGMAGNIYSERMLYHFRRVEADKQSKSSKEKGHPKEGKNKYSKVYVIPPRTGLFRYILYPHYVFEWLEWLGFALVGTAVFPSRQLSISSTYATPPINLAPWLVPAAKWAQNLSVPLPLPGLIFLVNAVANMLPHARWGRKWYVKMFGERAVAGRGAVVPYCSWM